MSTKILKGSQLDNEYHNKTIGQFFYDHAKKYSDKTWQVDAESGHEETYKEMLKKSIRLAIHFQNWKITPNNIIINCSTNNSDCAIPIISCSYIGAIIANVHPALLPQQIIHLLTLTNPTIIFVQESAVKLIEECLETAKIHCKLIVYGESNKYTKFLDLVQPLKDDEDGFKPVEIDVNSTAVIIFSSGTTGLPKAIQHSHKSFMYMVIRFVYSGLDFSSFLYFNPFYWVSALGFLPCCVAVGGMRVFSNKTDPEHIYKTIQKYKIKTAFLAPSLTYILTDYKNPKNFDTSSMTSFITGGCQIGVEQIERLDNIFPNSNTMFLYGMSEIGACSFFHMINDKHLIRKKRGAAGKVGANLQLKITDLNTGESLEANKTGEICVKTPSLTIGYYRGDFRKDLDQDLFFKTGDVGYYDNDNCIYVIERIKEMFKYKSWHIVPSLIEGVLLEHPKIAEVCVFGTPHEKDGEVPTACIVPKNSGTEIVKEEIDEFIIERLSDSERLRGGIFICDELMRTPTGKLMRKELRNKYVKK